MGLLVKMNVRGRASRHSPGLDEGTQSVMMSRREPFMLDVARNVMMS
jgi:hypothetical protein